jgi:hypothetical protein
MSMTPEKSARPADRGLDKILFTAHGIGDEQLAIFLKEIRLIRACPLPPLVEPDPRAGGDGHDRQ